MRTNHHTRHVNLCQLAICFVVFIFWPSLLQAALTPELKKLLAVMNVGSAFVVAPGYIVTNKHVVGDNKNVLFIRQDQSSFEGELVLDDADNDLALFYVAPEQIKLTPLPLVSENTSLGTQVFTIGFPHPAVLGISPKMTMGYISSERGFEDNPRSFQISVPLQSGNSGGPLLDMQGNVVGVTSWKLNADSMFRLTGDIPQNVNYATKVSSLKKLLNTIPIKWQSQKTQKSRPSLDTLVKVVQKSVFIVLAGAKDVNKNRANNLDPVKGQIFVDAVRLNQKLALIVYAEPQGDKLGVSGTGRSASLDSYSRTVADMISEELVFLAKNNIRISFSRAGNKATPFLYAADNKLSRKTFCQKPDIDLVFIVDYNNSSEIWSPNEVTLKLFECDTLNLHKQTVTVASDHRDKFITEIDLRKAVDNFFATLPGMIHWTGRE